MKAVKTIAALIFLSAIAIVLVQPVLGADDDPATRTRGRAETSDDPTTPPEDEVSAGEEVALAARYPRRCLRKTRSAASGLVAARRGSTAEIGFPDQRPVARIEVSGDVAWSPSGTFLAERGGRVFDQSGNPQGALFFEPREWQWSPVADCALATTEDGTLAFSIPDTKRKEVRLLSAPVQDFELSPNGKRLAAVIEDRGLWIADLRRGEIVQTTEGPSSLVGWFSNRSVVYSKSEGSGKLRYATGAGKTRVVKQGFPGRTLVRCGGRVFLLSQAVGTTSPMGELVSRRGKIRGARYLRGVPPNDGFSSAACSPDGDFVAASAIRGGGKGPLLLLGADGTFVRELVRGATAGARWSSEGLMYVKFPDSGRGIGRLWLIAPGADPFGTPYRVGAPTQYDWHVR